MAGASTWGRVQSFVPAEGRDDWRDQHPPGRLERLALNARAQSHVDEELLTELNEERGRVGSVLHAAGALARLPLRFDARTAAGLARSEERRVGKECRSRRSPYHY